MVNKFCISKRHTGLSDSVNPVGISRHTFSTDEAMHGKWMSLTKPNLANLVLTRWTRVQSIITYKNRPVSFFNYNLLEVILILIQ